MWSVRICLDGKATRDLHGYATKREAYEAALSMRRTSFIARDGHTYIIRV